MSPQLGKPLQRPALARRRTQVEKRPATDRALAGGIANHETIACRRRNRPVQHQLDATNLARRKWSIFEQYQASANVRGGVKQADRHPLGYRPGLRGEQPQLDIDPVGWCMQFEGSSTTSPREIASLLMLSPTRLRAHRCPATPRGLGWFWAWIDRTRAVKPFGEIITPSPVDTAPDRMVPVTTVPAPVSVNDRSTARRKRPDAARAWMM